MITPEKLSRVLNAIKPLVIQVGYKYKDNEGYVQMRLKKDYSLDMNEISFVPGRFDKNKYFFLGEPEPENCPKEVDDVITVYYSILWPNKEWFHVKEIIVLGKPKQIN